MRSASRSIVLLLPLFLVAACDDALTDPAAEESVPAPAIEAAEHIVIEPLTGPTRQEFTDDVAVQIRLKPDGRSRTVLNLHDASHIAVLKITVQAGARFPWHTHPGPVLVAVTAGEMAYVYADDCVERPYPAGTAFVDPGFDNVHTAFNPGTEDEAVLIATFLGAPPTGPLTIPVDAAEEAALDAKCGLSAAIHAH